MPCLPQLDGYTQQRKVTTSHTTLSWNDLDSTTQMKANNWPGDYIVGSIMPSKISNTE